MTADLNTGVFPTSSSLCFQLQPAEGTELSLMELPCTLLSPFRSSWGSCQASVIEQLVLGPALLSCLREAMPLQRINISNVVPTVVDGAFLTTAFLTPAASVTCVSKERLYPNSRIIKSAPTAGHFSPASWLLSSSKGFSPSAGRPE